MAPSSPLLSQPSPTKKSSQELPLFVNLAETAEPLPPNSARSRLGGNNGPSLLAIAEPAPAADLTPSLIADEMDVDNGARLDDEQLQAAAATVGGRPSPTAGQQAAAASQPAQQSQAAAPAAVRTPVRTPELQTTLPQRQASRPPAANGTYHEHANGRGTSQAREASPSTPGRIPPFDWEEFEARYEQALSEMNGQERDMLEEFDRLVNVGPSFPRPFLPSLTRLPSISMFGLLRPRHMTTNAL